MKIEGQKPQPRTFNCTHFRSGIFCALQKYRKGDRMPLMETFTPYSALIGGAMIGIAASLYLLLIGRVCGISGMVSDLITFHPNLRLSGPFLLGLLFGGLLLQFVWPQALLIEIAPPHWFVLLGGFCVGLGARMAGGCTSGHGVCGIGRGSPGSLVVTALFVLFGMISATLLYHLIFGDPHP